MRKPTVPRVLGACLLGCVLLLIAAWFSGASHEICEKAQSGDKECTTYNLAPFILIQIREALHSIEGVITSIATVAIAWFTWTLWQSSEKMWITTRDANSVAREIGQRQIRAYVAPSDIEASDIVAGMRLKISLSLRNTGQSPAGRLAARMGTRVGTDADRIPFRFPASDALTRGQISQNSEIILTCESNGPVSADQITRLRSGALKFVVGGYAIYKDVFGITRRNVFRFVLDPKSIDGGSSNGRFLTCKRNNRST